MLMNVAQVSKSFGANAVLNDISIHINAGERVGLVGANGSGKTTLLRIVTGEVEPTFGSVSVSAGVEVGYLPQNPPEPSSGATIDDLIYESLGGLRQMEGRLRELEAQMADPRADFEAVMAEYGELQERFDVRGGYELDHRIDIVLAGLDLGHLSRERVFTTLSGGEASRVMLASLLLRSPDLLLLDEPTNHLDFASIDWLGQYLAEHRGSVLVVSHDRHFLNRTVNRILEIDEHDHELTSYPGNYDDYLVVMERQRQEWEEDYAAQQIEINELRRAIKSTSAGMTEKIPARRDPDKSIYNAAGERAEKTAGKTIGWLRERLRRLESDPLPKPPELMRIRTDFGAEEIKSSEIIRLRGVSKQYDGRPVLKEADFILRRGEHVVIVGPNGSGKTTLLNVITGQLPAEGGEVTIASGARIGYLDQQARSLPLESTVMEIYRDGLVEYEHHLISDLLRHGLFTMDDLDKQVRELSAGQKRKLQLARMIAEGVNVLIVDEPTHYLSFDVLEEFERALREFPGPVLTVSHDRWFIERFGGRIWELRDGRLIEHHQEPDRVLADMLARAGVAAA